MNAQEFDQIAGYEWDRIPERFAAQMDNVAFLIEDEPSEEIRAEDHLAPDETLLGRYHGVPATERGAGYGVGGTLPDTITLYRLPILAHAAEIDRSFRDSVRIAIRETLWHEVGHYLGLNEGAVREREHEGTNHFDKEA